MLKIKLSTTWQQCDMYKFRFFALDSNTVDQQAYVFIAQGIYLNVTTNVEDYSLLWTTVEFYCIQYCTDIQLQSNASTLGLKLQTFEMCTFSINSLLTVNHNNMHACCSFDNHTGKSSLVPLLLQYYFASQLYTVV